MSKLLENKIRKIYKQIINENERTFNYKWEVTLPDGTVKNGIKKLTNTEFLDLAGGENVQTFDQLIDKWNRVAGLMNKNKSGLIWKYTKL